MISPSDRGVPAQQRLRLARFAMALILYVLCALVTLGGYRAGALAVAPETLWVLGLGALTTNAAIAFLITSGINLRLKDPSLTFVQCTLGLSWLVLFMHFVPQWRDLMLALIPIGIMFGLFHMDAREFTLLALTGFVALMALTTYEVTIGHPIYTNAELALRSAIGSGLLLWCAYFGNHVGRLRAKMKAHNSQLEQAIRDITRLAERDHLTQAFNRRLIIEILEQLRTAAERDQSTFSVIIIDVDYFKKINDRFGHLEGDQVLASIAKRVKSELRLLDEVAPVGGRGRELGRFGGEEFIITLPGTDLKGATQCADRIWRSIREYEFDHALKVTVSAGVASYEAQESIDDLLARADRALYGAKHAGRDQVLATDQETDPGSITGIVRLSDYQPER